MDKCVWPALTRGSACVRCGYALAKDYDRTPVRNCGIRNSVDYTADWLGELGLNGEQIADARQLFGDCPKGDCHTARAWKDKVREWWREQRP